MGWQPEGQDPYDGTDLAMETQGTVFQEWNPYLGDNVEGHTFKLLERYERLVDMAMADPRMNDAKVLPQLHTLLWSNKQGVWQGGLL